MKYKMQQALYGTSIYKNPAVLSENHCVVCHELRIWRDFPLDEVESSRQPLVSSGKKRRTIKPPSNPPSIEPRTHENDVVEFVMAAIPITALGANALALPFLSTARL